MNTIYRFIDDREPSETELKELMHEVAIEVKKKADIAKIKFSEDLKRQIKSTLASRNK